MRAQVGHTATEVWEALKEVKDPEIPALSLVELNVVRHVEVEGGRVTVTMVPTFSGCPAMEMMRKQVEERLRRLGFSAIDVEVHAGGVWSTDDLSDEARRKLRDFGIAPPPPRGDNLRAALALPVPCPFCRSTETNLENSFGSTLCKQLFYCSSCRQAFERFKPL